jgi:hypothetical protein
MSDSARVYRLVWIGETTQLSAREFALEREDLFMERGETDGYARDDLRAGRKSCGFLTRTLKKASVRS